jgi:hypothetical protein
MGKRASVIEIMVAALCIGDYRCDEATKAYLIQNPNPKIWAQANVQTAKKQATKVIGEQALIGLTTAAAAIGKKTYQIKISKHFSFGRSPDGVILAYGYNF